MNSKPLLIIVAVSAAALIATVTFQVLEMCDYKLFETLFK